MSNTVERLEKAVYDFSLLLEDLQNQQRYKEADAVNKKIKFYQTRLADAKRHNAQSSFIDYHQDIRREQNFKNRTFNRDWNQQLANLDEDSRIEYANFVGAQEKEYNDMRIKYETDPLPAFYPSCELCNLRALQEDQSRLRKFMDAHRTKMVADEMEAAELRLHSDIEQVKRKDSLIGLHEKHIRDRDALMERIMRDKKNARDKRQNDQDFLTNTYSTNLRNFQKSTEKQLAENEFADISAQSIHKARAHVVPLHPNISAGDVTIESSAAAQCPSATRELSLGMVNSSLYHTQPRQRSGTLGYESNVPGENTSLQTSAHSFISYHPSATPGISYHTSSTPNVKRFNVQAGDVNSVSTRAQSTGPILTTQGRAFGGSGGAGGGDGADDTTGSGGDKATAFGGVVTDSTGRGSSWRAGKKLNLSASKNNAEIDGSIANLDKDHDVVPQQNTDQWGRRFFKNGTSLLSSPHPLIPPVVLSRFEKHRTSTFYESQPKEPTVKPASSFTCAADGYTPSGESVRGRGWPTYKLPTGAERDYQDSERQTTTFIPSTTYKP